MEWSEWLNRVPVLMLVGATLLIVSLVTYFFVIHLNGNIPGSDVLTKNLNIYSDLIKPTPLACPNKDTLCDYYMASSGYTILPSTTVYTYITPKAIEKVVRAGSRLVELHIYEVNKKPVVGVGSKKTLKMLTYNTLPFEDCCTEIANSAFSADVTAGYKNPFVLSIVFHTNNTALINECADTMKTTLRKFMLDSSYSYQRKNLAVEPICNLMGKLIVTSDDATKGNGMEELVNISWSSSRMRRLTYTEAAQTYDHEELIEFNKRNITMVVPDMDTTAFKNSNPEICFSYGCQWVGMMYGSLDNAMEVYTGKFLESSFAIKPEPLRYKPLTYKEPSPQNPNVSFQPKRMTSPMYDFTIKST